MFAVRKSKCISEHDMRKNRRNVNARRSVMKIIEVISDTNIGGAGVLLVNRLTCTDLEKYRTEVLVPKDSRLKPRIEAVGAKCRELDVTGDSSFDVGAVMQYIRVFNTEKPDTVNCHGCLSARIAAWLCGVPVKICTRHCVFPVSAKERLLGNLNGILSDCFIAVAYSTKQNLTDMGIRENKIRVIINGAVPLRVSTAEEKKVMRKRLNIENGEAVIGLCARLEKYKGHECFLRAVRELLRRGIKVKALLLGDGTQRAELEKMCRDYGIENAVRFCGFVSDVASYMNIVDVNINCSVGTETSSLALSEGMSLGIPAVVSDYGGNPYMVKHGANGFVFKCGDSVQMADCIQRLLEDRELYVRMSHEARKRFELELNAESMTKKTNKLYDALYRKHVTEPCSKS